MAARTEDLAEILHTSGTTGTSKPIAVSHANLSFGQDTRGGLFAGSTGVLSRSRSGPTRATAPSSWR